MTEELTLPWERQKGESNVAFIAFGTYRDAGPLRTINHTARVLGKSSSTLGEWSRKFQWAMRAAAWDDENDRIRREAQQKEIEEMATRHAAQAQRMMQALVLPTVAALQKASQDPTAMQELQAEPLKELLGMISRAAMVWPNVMRAERLARGMPADIVEEQISAAPQRTAVPIASLPVDVAEQIIELLDSVEDDNGTNDSGN